MQTAQRIARGAERRAANKPTNFSAGVRAQLGAIAASAPVIVPALADEPYTGPLRCDLYPTTIRVDVEWVEVKRPTIHGADPRETQRAAVRAQLESCHEYGPVTHVSAMVVDGDTVRTIVLEGSVGAVRQAFLDRDRLVDLAAAGAQEFVSWDLTGRRRVERVKSIFQAPKALQVELETRGLAALHRVLTLAAENAKRGAFGEDMALALA